MCKASRYGRTARRRCSLKFLPTICLLLISTATSAEAAGGGQWAVGGAEARVARTSLTRAQTKEAERRLSELGYWTGAVDGVFDPATRAALVAFQKWEGRAVTGRLTLDELEAIRNSTPPTAREIGYAHVEVDLDRQVLLIVNHEGEIANNDELVNNGRMANNSEMINDAGDHASNVGRRDGLGVGVRVLPISSGSGGPFMDEGQQSVAHTPRGRFLVYDKVEGWEQGAFRGMYYSNYISGGVAIHGYESVPNQPASHGCIRIPLFAAREVSRLLPIGTIVLVYDKVSFVSGKPWAENPELKQAILDWNRTVGN